MVDPKGKILFDGDWINDKFVGNELKEVEMYIGEYKDGLRHGKGTLYYLNGDIKYEGDFVNDKFEGNGKYILEDGEYYIGQFKNGKRHGKGIEYYEDGNIEYDGDWVNDKPEGNENLFEKMVNILYVNGKMD